MKRFVLYMEIQGLGEDENGNPQPAGAKLDFGVELEDEKHKELMEKTTPDFEKLLDLVGLEMIASPEDCRLISEQEYIEKYGED